MTSDVQLDVYSPQTLLPDNREILIVNKYVAGPKCKIELVVGRIRGRRDIDRDRNMFASEDSVKIRETSAKDKLNKHK